VLHDAPCPGQPVEETGTPYRAVPDHRSVGSPGPDGRLHGGSPQQATAPTVRLPDPRITRVGRILRRTRIDELPQFWNVLKGEMSVVGPRPERPEFWDEISDRFPYFRVRSAYKPGITGWAQVRSGYVADIDGFEQKLALDLYYMRNWSLSLDLSIMWTTLRTVFSLSGV